MKVVTVHRGARDGYQVSRALGEAGLLEALVTDLYWPADHGWARAVERFAPGAAGGALRQRYADSLPSDSVVQCWGSGLVSLAASKVKPLSFKLQRETVRWCDRTLGRRAGELATKRGAALLSYSYYGHSAFSHCGGDRPRILFQLHPHPARVRTILREERRLHLECASSLDKEWELALPEEDFDRLVQESSMPEHWLAASSFTKRTLVESGVPPELIHVIPYGADLEKFSPARSRRSVRHPLQLLFVGTLSQRKGLKYLLEALDLFPAGSVELTVCGRPVDDLKLFRNRRAPIRLQPSISAQGLLNAYRSSDIFVFPSLAEGFGHVLLEAMACGLPVISTTRTAAPDLIRHGKEGFIIEPGNILEIASHIEAFLRHPEKVVSMGRAARERAEYYTWGRFRRTVATVVGSILRSSPAHILAHNHV